MATPTIAEYFKYAQLQMAAEAFLKNQITNAEYYSGNNLVNALVRGNDRYTKFVESEAKKFAEHWVVVDQCPNTPTGFSGTLFRCIKADPLSGANVGDRVISFRSTEFIDDAIRDSAATNKLEIHDTGWAWGQIADMEAWYVELQEKKFITETMRPTVIGYSLAGHLATAFNLLHRNDGKIGQVITFNGAGVGEMKGASNWRETGEELKKAVEYFNTLRTKPTELREKFESGVTDAELMVFYDSVRTKFVDDFGVIDGQKALNALRSHHRYALDQGSFKKEATPLEKALESIVKLQTEAERIKDYVSGTQGMPKLQPVDADKIAAMSLDYQMALYYVSQRLDVGVRLRLTANLQFSMLYGCCDYAQHDGVCRLAARNDAVWEIAA